MLLIFIVKVNTLMLSLFHMSNIMLLFLCFRIFMITFLYSFFPLLGAMLVICDVNEYRKLVKEEMCVPLVTQLFESLHALCNLLVVVPENIKVVSSGEQLVSGQARLRLSLSALEQHKSCLGIGISQSHKGLNGLDVRKCIKKQCFYIIELKIAEHFGNVNA